MRALAAAVLLVPALAFADDPAVSITLHDASMPTGSVAIVSERRTVDLAAGVSSVRFDGLPPIHEGSLLLLDETDPATRIHSLAIEPGASAPHAYLANRRGQKLVVTTVRGEETGELVTWEGEDMVLRRADGTTVAIRLPHVVSIHVPGVVGVPDSYGVAARVETARPGPHTLRLVYRTGSLGWRADYSAVVGEDASLDVQGWVTLTNESTAEWRDAELRLVTAPSAPTTRGAGPYYDEYQPAPPVVVLEPRTVTLDGRHNIAARASRQTAILAARLQPKSRVVVYERVPTPGGYYDPGQPILDQYPEGPNPLLTTELDVFVELANTRAAGLGAPLPPGRIQIYRRAGARLEDAGEDAVPIVAAGESFRVRLAKIPDVSVERRQRDFRLDESAREMREEMEIVFKNRRREAVEILAVEHMYRGSTWIIEAESGPSKRGPTGDSGTASFRVRVPAGGTQTLTYTVLYTW